MTSHAELVERWLQVGPIAWGESQFGWILPGGRPAALTPWQRACLAAWWERRASVTTLGLSNVKKTGKTFLNALLTAWRWLAIPGEHFVAGNDLDQSTARQFGEISAMVKRHPYLSSTCKVDKQRLEFKPTGSVLIALATDATGNAGSNHVTASHTEAWGILLEAGIRAFEELTPPPGLFSGLPALRIVDSYAGFETDSDTWHKLVDLALAGEPVCDDWPIYQNGGTLVFHAEGLEAQRDCFRGTPMQAKEYYADQQQQLRPMAYRRMHLNQRTAGAEQFICEADWRAITDPDLLPLRPSKITPLYVGLDVGVKHDYCAVIGAIPNGVRQARLALHRIWKPAPGRQVDLAEVMGYLLALHRDYWLAGVFYDPSQALLMAQALQAKGLRLVEVPQTLPELGPRGLVLWEAIRDRRLRVYESDELLQAALAAVAREVPQGLHLKKGSSARKKIDPIAALSFCLPAAIASEGVANWESVQDLGHVDGFVSRWTEPGEGPVSLGRLWR